MPAEGTHLIFGLSVGVPLQCEFLKSFEDRWLVRLDTFLEPALIKDRQSSLPRHAIGRLS